MTLSREDQSYIAPSQQKEPGQSQASSSRRIYPIYPALADYSYFQASVPVERGGRVSHGLRRQFSQQKIICDIEKQ